MYRISRDYEADNSTARDGASNRAVICDRCVRDVHVVGVVRHPRLYRRAIGPNNADGGCRSACVDHIHRQLPIRVDKRRCSEAITTRGIYPDGAWSYSPAVLREGPEALRYLIRISLDQNKFFVVIVIRCPILCSSPL